MKGLILSGGKGTRLRPITHTSAKQLVPVANKPVLFYGIEAMAQAGIEEVGIIIAPETGDEIRAAAGDGSQFGVRITYVEQDEPLGLAHAALTAEPFLDGDPFVMYLGDNLLQGGITELVESFRASGPDALILLTPVPDPQNYGVAELDGGRVVRLVEKPAQPATDLALVGVYMFTAGIHDASRAIEPSARGELEITDAIQYLVDGGRRVEPHIVRGWWKDTGRLDDMLEANRLVLDRIDRRIDGTLVESQCEGRVVIEAGAQLRAHDRPRAGDHRRRGAPDGLLRRPVHGDRRGLRHLRGGGRALDPARGQHRLAARGADGVLAAGPQRHDLARRAPAARVPLHGRRQLRDRDPVRLLVTGAGGMLGRAVVEAAMQRGHEVLRRDARGRRHHRRGRRCCRRCSSGARRRSSTAPRTPTSTAPRAIATTAEAVNRTGAGNVAAAAAEVGASIVHVSTDYVFDGSKREPWLESDPTGPLGVYGETKLARRAGGRGANADHAIVRTAWLFGAGGRNFVDTMLALGAQRDEVAVVTDQVGCPTWTGHLAGALVALAERPRDRASTTSPAPGRARGTSWRRSSSRARASRAACAPRRARTSRVPRERPAYSVLGSERADPIVLPAWQQGVAEYLATRVTA